MILKVATFNLKSSGFGSHSLSNRKQIIVDTFKLLDADIVGVQELNSNLHKYFANELPEYNFVGKGRGGLILNEHSDIALKSTVKINYESTFRLSNSKSGRPAFIKYPLSWIFPRICTIAEIAIEGVKIRVFNTHLDVISERARIYQMRLICRRMIELAESEPLPTILTGDFNASLGSKTLNLLDELEIMKLNGTAKIDTEVKNGTLHFFRGGDSIRRIDHIFASREFKLLDERIVKYSKGGIYPSDHYPIVAVFEI